MRTAALCTLALLSSASIAFTQGDDPILRAMGDELKRSMTLKLQNLDTPYFIEYELDDVQEFSASASLGGLLGTTQNHFRLPRVHVRVGDYKFDNTNWVGSGFNFGPRYDIRVPLDNSYAILRQNLWLATDQAYKSAVEAIARKRAALKNISVSEEIPDFAPAKPFTLLGSSAIAMPTSAEWVDRIRSLSGIFANYPKLKASGTEITMIDGARYYLNTEGTEVRTGDKMAVIRIRAYAQAADGMTVRDSAVFETRDLKRLPSDAELTRATKELAETVTALSQSVVAENYSGPVLFEGTAGSQIFAEILGRSLSLTRKPVLEPGSPGSVAVSELEGRKGARILPDFFNVVDDPTQTEWKGTPLFGAYEVDDEGVPPGAISIVDKGILKNFLMTRQPVRGFSGSNGHARLAGQFGAKSAVPGNLFITASESSSVPDLKKKLIEMCVERQKPYGILVRKMDFPSSASLEEARRIIGNAGQGGSRPTSLPLLVFRVYPDGREERVRGIRFRGLNIRSLKDILAAGNDSNMFDYMENGAPFALMGVGAEFAQVSVVAPSILVDDLELLKIEEELPKLPVVPPPTLSRLSSR